VPSWIILWHNPLGNKLRYKYTKNIWPFYRILFYPILTVLYFFPNMVSAKRKSSCTSDDICQKQHKMMKCRGRRNRKRCTCRYDCNNFGESSVCAYSPSDYEMPEVFENSCALSYQECLTGVKFTIQCRGDLCTNDYCYPDHGEVPVNLKQQVCSSENLEKLGFGDPCRRGSVCLNHVWKAGNEKGEGKTAFVNTKQKFEVSKLKNFKNSFNDSDLVNYRLHTSCECDRDHSGQFCDNFQKLQAIDQNTRHSDAQKGLMRH
jgi:hypothetical protein